MKRVNPEMGAGPWSLNFKGLDAPPDLTLNLLTDLSRSDQEAVRCFSGEIDYTHTFEWKEPTNGTYRLSLGTLATAAKVSLNGVSCGTVWDSPNEADVTHALKPGQNKLEIRVANTWANRLIGDARLPESQRKTWTTCNEYTPDSDVAKIPSGLIGPVAIRAEKF